MAFCSLIIQSVCALWGLEKEKGSQRGSSLLLRRLHPHPQRVQVALSSSSKDEDYDEQSAILGQGFSLGSLPTETGSHGGCHTWLASHKRFQEDVLNRLSFLNARSQTHAVMMNTKPAPTMEDEVEGREAVLLALQGSRGIPLM